MSKTILLQKLDYAYNLQSIKNESVQAQEMLHFAKLLHFLDYKVFIVINDDDNFVSLKPHKHDITYVSIKQAKQLLNYKLIQHHILWNGWIKFARNKEALELQLQLFNNSTCKKYIIETDSRVHDFTVLDTTLSNLDDITFITQARNLSYVSMLGFKNAKYMPLHNLPLAYAKKLHKLTFENNRTFDLVATTNTLSKTMMSAYRYNTIMQSLVSNKQFKLGVIAASYSVNECKQFTYNLEQEDVIATIVSNIPYSNMIQYLATNAKYCIVASHSTYIETQLSTNRIAECIAAKTIPIIHNESYCNEFADYPLLETALSTSLLNINRLEKHETDIKAMLELYAANCVDVLLLDIQQTFC